MALLQKSPSITMEGLRSLPGLGTILMNSNGPNIARTVQKQYCRRRIRTLTLPLHSCFIPLNYLIVDRFYKFTYAFFNYQIYPFFYWKYCKIPSKFHLFTDGSVFPISPSFFRKCTFLYFWHKGH